MSAGETNPKAPSIRDISYWVTGEKTIVMDESVEQSLLDTAPDPLVGLPVNRIEGPLKVAGEAHYAAEYSLPGLVTASWFKLRLPSVGSKVSMCQRQKQCPAYWRSSMTISYPGKLANSGEANHRCKV